MTEQDLRREIERLTKSLDLKTADLTELYSELDSKSEELKAAYSEINALKDRIAKLTGENEAYKAMIDTYQSIHANEVDETCPNCGNRFTVKLNKGTNDYIAYCPYCSKRVVICDGDLEGTTYCRLCFYDSDLGCCKYPKGERE